jgi:hypothetical protein
MGVWMDEGKTFALYFVIKLLFSSEVLLEMMITG